jgi:hypothetical protein
LEAWCTANIPELVPGTTPETPAAVVYPDFADELQGISSLQQCTAEQKYVRGAMTRALLYLQVSIR